MKFKFLNAALAGVVLSASSLVNVANAGLIEADIYGDGSNKGFTIEGSNIEWMDFGENNEDTFSFVASNLDEGSKYQGWELATEKQVMNMWIAAFEGFNGIADSYIPNYWGPGALQTRSTGDLFSDVFNVLGYNQQVIINSNGFVGYNRDSTGFFLSENGVVNSVRVIEYEDVIMSDTSYLDLNSHPSFMLDYDMPAMSTMLVRSSSNAIDVPEPSTLAIFALGVIGLASRRLKKQS